MAIDSDQDRASALLQGWRIPESTLDEDWERRQASYLFANEADINTSAGYTLFPQSIIRGRATMPVLGKDSGQLLEGSVGVGGAAVSSADATTAVDVTDAPESGKKLIITDVYVSVDTAMRVDLLEEDGSVKFSGYMAANSWAQLTPRGTLKLSTADKKLQCQTSAAGNIRVTAFYYSEE